MLLAQFNIAEMRHPRHSAAMADYHEVMDRVMPIARDWPGFVWLMEDDIIPLAEAAFGPRCAANLSLWRDIESLKSFMDCPSHRAAMDRRNNWFVPIESATVVLWWVPARERPDFHEACRRLNLLRRIGPSPQAFSLESPCPPPGEGRGPVSRSA